MIRYNPTLKLGTIVESKENGDRLMGGVRYRGGGDGCCVVGSGDSGRALVS